MPITTKHTTVYIASDGSEHATLEAAQDHDTHCRLCQIVRRRDTVSGMTVAQVARMIIEEWPSLTAAMATPEDELPAVQAAAETILADAALVCTECEQPRNGIHLPSCRRSGIVRRTHCEMDTEHPRVPIGDYVEDWGGANVAPRPERSIPRLPMRACAECGRTSRSGAHEPSCSRYVKTDV